MKILVVEDEQQISKYIKKGLEQKGHIVDVAEDGEVGLDLALGEDYDVIILDLMLPKIDGLDVCKQIRAQENNVPILMLTARGEVIDRVTGLEVGADDYLVKPFAFAELVARLQALVRRPATFTSNVLTYDDLTMDLVTATVKRGRKEIQLSKKEFALLEFLLRRPDQVVTAQQITEQVWDYDSDVLPNTAQVYMGYLRKKIDKPFKDKKPLLNTIRGFGYYLGYRKK